MSPEMTRDHGDVVVARERLAELREELRGRLDPRRVVLVQDEDAAPGSGHGKASYKL